MSLSLLTDYGGKIEVFSAFNISEQVDPTEKAAINHKYPQHVPCVSPLRLQLPGFGLVQLISSHLTSFSNSSPIWAKKAMRSPRSLLRPQAFKTRAMSGVVSYTQGLEPFCPAG